jgi:outer membrane protein OmpA-like peptidoglycan-associated protein
MKNSRAWRLLTELEQGMSPTFYYDGWVDGKDKVIVSLSTVRFFDAYDQFLSCLDQLPILKVKKEHIENTHNAVINFRSNKYSFTQKAGKKLEKIYAYVKGNDVELVLISGYTDSQGAHPYNDMLSKKRANAVSDFFTKQGINANKIKIQSYGERNPVDDNATNKGRAKNRRVLIKII